MESLSTITATLERLTGVPAAPYPRPEALTLGQRTIRAEREKIFGAPSEAHIQGLMATIPDAAADDPRLVRDLMHAGMGCARIDCSQSGPARWCEIIVNIRIAERELDRPCKIVMDAAGARARVAEVSGQEKRRVVKGEIIVLTDDIAHAPKRGVSFSCVPPGIASRLSLGDRVWINDGRIAAQVVAHSGETAHLEIVATRPKGDKIKTNKSVRFAGVDLAPLAAGRLQEETLDFIAENADACITSLVRTRDDVAKLQRQLRERRGGQAAMPIILAIETAQAAEGLAQLIAQAASGNPTAVMLAEADLSIELGAERMAHLRGQLVRTCRAAHVPIAWTTAALDSLVKEGIPARAAAASVLAGSDYDCIRLDSGPNLVEALAFVMDVLSPDAHLAGAPATRAAAQINQH